MFKNVDVYLRYISVFRYFLFLAQNELLAGR